MSGPSVRPNKSKQAESCLRQPGVELRVKVTWSESPARKWHRS